MTACACCKRADCPAAGRTGSCPRCGIRDGVGGDICHPCQMAVGQELVDWDWVVTSTWLTLHHVTLPPAQAQAIYDYRQIGTSDDEAGPVLLACGRTVRYVSIPGFMSRLSKPRCKVCCRRLGFPQGKGSPKNDDACRELLGMGAES